MFVSAAKVLALIDKLWREALERSYESAEQYLQTAERSMLQAAGTSSTGDADGGCAARTARTTSWECGVARRGTVGEEEELKRVRGDGCR